MFLVSGTDLVVAACKSGIVGAFPALNARTSETLVTWLDDINQRLDQARATQSAAPYAVNLIAHRSNRRFDVDLDVCMQARVPLVITSIGAVPDVVSRVHDWGGLIFHDVGTVRHAEKAAAAGVDGLILVCAGGGGHSLDMNPFAFLSEVRSFFSGTIVLAGCITNGGDIAAARVMGADLAYMGTRFICATESLASARYRQMILNARSSDVVHTAAFSGAPATFLRQSIVDAGLDPTNLTDRERGDFSELASGAKAWKDILGAGQGVGAIGDILPVAQLVTRMEGEYTRAAQRTSFSELSHPAHQAAP